MKPTYRSQDPLVKLQERMRLRGLSKKTQKSYLYYIRACLVWSKKGAREVNTEDVAAFLSSLVETGRSASTLNTAYSALKYYFDGVLKRHFFVSLPRVKKRKTLPVVLSKEEVRTMIEETKNLKHRTIIELLYGAGLRVGELVRLRMSCFDFDRNLIHIRRSKGAKDRIVPLPRRLWSVLHSQKELKDTHDYLFTGRHGGRLTETTVQKIVAAAAGAAHLHKSVTPHTLRHSYATHLLESGTDIRYIQELLGHANVQTTQIYTKVAVNHLIDIISPLDAN